MGFDANMTAEDMRGYWDESHRNTIVRHGVQYDLITASNGAQYVIATAAE